ncbi:DUF1028 domain-containing protein [Chryseomicrobium sp. FSL W7-1435]|uniref:DUF1028 domain-containing protein n=1 Tax=Chryseomicrobium sp. FSL W7-1435 TaxID=2921704 RepID=UPI003159A323
MTFSIVGFDEKTKELGIAVASKFLGVGAVVPFAKAGVGAIATQSLANLSYGVEGLELLEKGLSPLEVVEELTKKDDNAAWRQVGIVDVTGQSATYTGEDCYDWAGGAAAKNYAIQGNILVNQQVVEQMEATFEQTNGPLPERLLAALLAGDAAGGDSRGRQSAALLVVKENGSYGGYTDRYIDLRIDDHHDPVQELSRLLKLRHLYFEKADQADVMTLTESQQSQLAEHLHTLGYLEHSTATAEEIHVGLDRYHHTENFEERQQPSGQIDRKVFEYIEEQAKGFTAK